MGDDVSRSVASVLPTFNGFAKRQLRSFSRVRQELFVFKYAVVLDAFFL